MGIGRSAILPFAKIPASRGSLMSPSAYFSQSYWEQQSEVLFFAYDSTDILNKVAGGQLPNQKAGSSDYLTVTGTGLNARYRTPNTSAYKNADNENVFWKTDASESICDGNRLIAYDFSHIIIFYLNISPYTIKAIMILSSTIAGGSAKENKMRDDFKLSVWWSNVYSFHGAIKVNKPLAQQYVWTPESVAPPIPTGLTLTLIAGGVKIDWTDNSGGTAQTEIWAQSDGATSALLYTINAGIVTKNDLLAPVDLRYYKIRAKDGSNYSAFTSELSIAMLGPEVLIYGDFLDPTKWALSSTWTISGGKLNYLATAVDIVYYAPLITLQIGATYRFRFEITDCPITGKFIPTTSGGGIIFNAPYNAWQVLGNGSYEWTVVIAATSNDSFGIYGDNTVGIFSFKNMSLKKIL